MSDGHDQAPLWMPTAEMAANARMTDFMGWAGRRHGRTFADYGELWAWSVQEVEQFWADIWEYCGVRASKPYERVLASKARCRARAGSRARSSTTRRTCSRASAIPQATALLYASELRPLAELSWGELSEQVAAARGWLALARRGARRSRGRLHAEHSRDADRFPGMRQHRRDLVVRGARVRRAQRCRSLRPDRAEGAARRRRLPPRRQGLRPHGRPADDLGRAAERRPHGDAPLPGQARQAPRDCRAGSCGRSCSRVGRGRRRTSSRCRSTIPCGCSTPQGRPACPRRSCTATAASWSSS